MFLITKGLLIGTWLPQMSMPVLYILKERNRPSYDRKILDYYTKFNFFAAHKNTIDSKSDEIITENDMAFKEFVI